LIGLSFIVQGHTDKAATYFSDAELYDELLDRGTSALAAHKPTAAKMWLRVAADANPANSSAWCALAGASADPNETIALETRATRLDQEWRSESERINCWFDLAVRQFGIGSYTEAMAAFRNIVRMVPASPADRRKISESYRHQAMIVARTQSKSAAWSIFRKARLEDETNPWAIVSDAVNQFELSKNVQDLLTALRHAIAVDPHNGEVIEEVQRLARRYELPLERLTNVKSRSGIGR
jgi:cytochrome c-type biogenesis protein CcmH/NrfG